MTSTDILNEIWKVYWDIEIPAKLVGYDKVACEALQKVKPRSDDEIIILFHEMLKVKNGSV